MNDILIKILVSIGILVLTNVFVYLSNLSKEKIAKIENIKFREASSKLLDIIATWNDTKASIEKILDNESKEILGKAYGDLNDYINQTLEDEVKRQKESK